MSSKNLVKLVLSWKDSISIMKNFFRFYDCYKGVLDVVKVGQPLKHPISHTFLRFSKALAILSLLRGA